MNIECNPNPSGLCMCGCGERTTVSPSNDTSRGHIKGRPRRFLPYHHNKSHVCGRDLRATHSAGYVLILAPDHPRSASGRAYEHILVAERALGKPLPEGAEVHHVNGDKADNRPANLVVCQDAAYHRLLHVRQRAMDATGDPSRRHCALCKTWDDPAVMYWNKANGQYRHRACHTRRQKERYHRRRREAA